MLRSLASTTVLLMSSVTVSTVLSSSLARPRPRVQEWGGDQDSSELSRTQTEDSASWTRERVESWYRAARCTMSVQGRSSTGGGARETGGREESSEERSRESWHSAV